MGYDKYCSECPYFYQKHLPDSAKTTRSSPPIGLESNDSKVLLVFQSPGEEEWNVGMAIQPTKKRGGTAGSRIAQSWGRTGCARHNFDIINVVQCFPGKIYGGNSGGRDAKPNQMAICACAYRLKNVFESQQYKRVIAFGEIAQDVVKSISSTTGFSGQVVEARHPSSGMTRSELDLLWQESANK